MLGVFLTINSLIYLFLACVWKTSDLFNAVLKTIFALMFILSSILAFAQYGIVTVRH